MEDTEDKKIEEESCTDVQEELRHGIERMDIDKDVVPGATHIAYYGPVINIASGEAPITIGNIEQGMTRTWDKVGTVLENVPGNSEVTTGSAMFAYPSIQDVNGDKEAVVSKPQSANAFSGLREKYRKDCSRHEVNCVDTMENCIISLDLDINDFSVNLKIVEEEKRYTAKDKGYHGELEKHLHLLKDDARAIKVGELMNMIEDNEKERIMFVSGLAGIGKSVLAKKVALDWACKECSQTRCLFYITCRELNSFFHESDRDIEEYLKEQFRNMPFDNVETTVFLIDGLDELQKPVKIMKAFTEKFSKSRFIILGRPHARHHVNSIGQKSQKLEILGLNKGQIKEYIKKFPKLSTDKSQDESSLTEQKIEEAIQKSTNISYIATIPQFLNTICCAVMLSTEGKSFTSKTDLYSWMLFLLMRQHFQGKDLDNKTVGWEIFSCYSKQLLAICKQAFKLYSSGSIIFKKTELECKDEKFIEGFLLGVKNRAGDISKYMFKHLTIMEFLASIHVYLDGKRNVLLKKLLKQERYEIISFVCSFVRFSLIKGTSFEEDDEISYQLVEKFANGKEVAKNCGDGVITYEDPQSVILGILNQLPNDEVLLKVRFLADCFVASDKVRDVKFFEELLKSIKPSSNVEVELNTFDQSNLLSILKLATGNKVAISEIKNAFSGIKFGILDLREMEILDYALWIDIGYVRLNDVNRFTEHQSMSVHRNLAFCRDVRFRNCKVPLFTTNANESTTTMKLKGLTMERVRIDEADVSSAANLIGVAEKVWLYHVRVGGKEFEKIVEELIQIKPRRLREMELHECPLVNAELKQKIKENGVMIYEFDPRSILLLCQPDSRNFVLQLKENLDDKNGYIAMDENIEEFERRYNELPRILVVFIQHQIPEEVERDILFAQNEMIKILLVKLEADFHPSNAMSSVFDSNPCLNFTDKRNNTEMASELNWNIQAIMDGKFIVISNAPGNQVEANKIQQKFADEIGCPVFVNIELEKYYPRVVVVLLTDGYEESQQCKEMMDYPKYPGYLKIIAVKLDNDFQPGDRLNDIRGDGVVKWLLK
eukprot:gene14763-biopygen11849